MDKPLEATWFNYSLSTPVSGEAEAKTMESDNKAIKQNKGIVILLQKTCFCKRSLRTKIKVPSPSTQWVHVERVSSCKLNSRMYLSDL